jgi:nucleoside-diphosphate-sugar epimerase
MFLITGASGFIGGWLVRSLVSQGRQVRCLVRRTSATARLGGAQLAYGDLVSGEGLAAALDGVDCVIHLAGVTKALRARDYYTGNAGATATLVRAMEGSGARLVHVSSLAAAGPSDDGILLDEDALPRPVSHYGKSKLAAEQAARGRAGSVIVRPPVVYGPHDTDVFQVLESVRRGLVLEIAGGARRFSAIYAGDLAEGLIAAACVGGAAGRTYYLTFPEPQTWGEFTATAARIMGRRVRTVRVPAAAARAVGLAAEMWSWTRRRPGILSRDKIVEACSPHWTCSGARAARELGFTARTGLEEGLRRTLEWYAEAGWMSW